MKKRGSSIAGFADAPIKGEGQSVGGQYGFPEHYKPVSPEVITTWVERRVPQELEAEFHILIDSWLRIKGFNPEDI
jgi:hypothetical protein